jgi:hypothetical protein
MKEPRPRKDGTCFVCHKPRRLDQTRLYRVQAEKDPFDSRFCCEETVSYTHKTLPTT